MSNPLTEQLEKTLSTIDAKLAAAFRKAHVKPPKEASQFAGALARVEAKDKRAATHIRGIKEQRHAVWLQLRDARGTLVLYATPHKDETFVQSNNRKPRDPWLKDVEKVPEPTYKEDGPMAKLFKTEDEPAVDDISTVISASELTTFTKTGKLHEFLKKKGFAFQWDHENRCFWLTEYREVRAKQSKIQEGSKKYNSLEVKKRADAEMKVLEVAVCVFASEGMYWFTNDAWNLSYVQETLFTAFKTKFMELSEGLKMREAI